LNHTRVFKEATVSTRWINTQHLDLMHCRLESYTPAITSATSGTSPTHTVAWRYALLLKAGTKTLTGRKYLRTSQPIRATSQSFG